MARRRKPRRGIVLLIILTLLTLLIVVGLTFALLSGQYRRAAESSARQQRYGDPAEKILDRVVNQLVRDTNDSTSAFYQHSLLRDLYGESVRGRQIGAAAVSGGGQFLEFTASLQIDPNNSGTTELGEVSQSLRTNGFFNGCVLTFLEGQLAKVSTRIVGYAMVLNGGLPSFQFRVLVPTRDDLTIEPSEIGNWFVINGRAFVGTGAGYEGDVGAADYGRLSRARSFGGESFPEALLPHRFNEPLANTFTNYLQGGLNESYDAADYQNVFLAAVVPDTANPTQIRVLPSFHPVALINYWANHSSGMWNPTSTGYKDLRRAVVFRPMPWDHPNFDGGNIALAGTWDPGPDSVLNTLDDVLTNDADLNAALLQGPWDVDCDGDGTRDAVWIDPGFPAQTDASGRRYKPLVAVLCTDMDGKLNLNVHGNLSHLTMLSPSTQTAPVPVSLPQNAGTAVSSADVLPSGSGYGPPEVSLAGLFTTPAEYQALLQGNVALGIPGRYGLNLVPGDDGIPTLSLLKMFEYPPALPAASPTNFFLPATPLSAFSTPFDLRGEFAFGLDFRGLPVWERSTETNVLINTAYELNVSLNTPRGLSASPVPDMPFSAAELERLLRPYDVDALSLPDRLWHLVDAFRNDPAARRAVTTDQYDPPSPGILAWPELRDEFVALGMDRPRHIVDLLRARLIDARSLMSGQLDDPARINRLNHDLALLLSPEMVLGVRFDVNRPFGNGRDDPSPVTGNVNQVVDDHGVGVGDFRGEDVTDERVWGGIRFDHDNDGVIGGDDNAFLARQLYAKHLYVLMMAIKPSSVQIDFDGDPSNDNATETAYGLAQWAVNVVDFRDADSIMTPFEFDIDPFDDYDPAEGNAYGWEVDGVLGSTDDGTVERGLVWGCERPELLISEAFAIHQRSTEDLGEGGGTTTSATPDDDFDQRLRPRGSFFCELYNPWAGDERHPGEFYYDEASGAWSPGVMLNQVTQGSGARFPVWRVAIAKGTDRDLDPDHWDPTQRMPNSAIERLVYFTPFAGPVVAGELAYYTDLPVAPILPGRYAVVGSAGQNVDEAGNPLDLDGDGVRDYMTTLGRLTTAIEDGAGGLNYGGTRRIVLEPSLNVTQHQAQVLGNGAATPEPLPPDVQPSVGVVINQPSSLNVSEPLAGYPLAGPGGEVWDPTLADYEGAYAPALDEPLDTDTELMNDGTTDDYCVVLLQRLANPLLPYDPLLNPYRTIDSMSSDMSAFNGVTSDVDPNSGNDTPRMTTRERGRSLAAADVRVLWKHEPGVSEGGAQSPASVPETTPVHYLSEVLGHTFGYLNQPYHPFYTNAAHPVPDVVSNRPADYYVGAPAVDATHPPFPWLTWNNRPFVSQYEMMLVPKSRSSRLPHEYDLQPPGTSSYAGGSPGLFRHLLNFFETSDSAPPAANGANLYRLFELTHVPSRFVETDLYLNPNLFAGNTTPGSEFLHPPFNRISQYRDPGRINLNTIFNQGIWNGLLANHIGPRWQWQDFVTSRRGFGAVSPEMFDLTDPITAQYPSFFTNPWRPVGAAQLAPTTASGARLDRLEIESTLLRSTEISYEGDSDDLPAALWENPSTTPYDQHYNNPDRNPYFRYQSLSRLGNLVTTRSNVFAVWLTVGYFEVEPSPDANTPAGLAVHPDGYRLGKELGSDTGNVKRHRAFYLIDRSIPVAFEPGENHNVDRAILLRRFIE